MIKESNLLNFMIEIWNLTCMNKNNKRIYSFHGLCIVLSECYIYSKRLGLAEMWLETPRTG